MAAERKKKVREDIEPWERQPGEQLMAFRCFAAYRDMGANGGRRSIEKTAKSVTKNDGTPHSAGTLRNWSRKHNWRERVDAWDAWCDKQAREEVLRGRTAMLRRHTDIAQAMLVKAVKAMQRIPDDELTAQDITRMVDTASKLERISRGDVTERTESRQTSADITITLIDPATGEKTNVR